MDVLCIGLYMFVCLTLWGSQARRYVVFTLYFGLTIISPDDDVMVEEGASSKDTQRFES